MKSTIKRIAVAALSAIMLVAAFGCGKDSSIDTDSTSGEENLNSGYETIENEYIVKDGKSEYSILYSEDLIATSNGKLAVEELQTFIFNSTGVTLETKTSVSSTEKFISLGKTDRFTSAGLTAEYGDLGGQGFVIDTIDNNVYISGAQDMGTLYGVYEFLSATIDFAVYGPEITDYAKKEEIPLYDIGITDKPDIDYFMNAYGFYGNQGSQINEQGIRLRINKSPMYTVGGQFAHTALKYFSDKDFTDNPEWLGTCGNQLCYTARGDKDKLSAMIEHVFTVMKDKITANPNQHFMPFMQEDYNTWCGCDECKKVIEEHGGVETSTQILFINRLADKLKAWLEENYPESDIIITFFAYNNTTAAPVKESPDGGYVPLSEDMVLRDNVGVFYAPIGANYYYSLFDDINSAYGDTMKKWSILSENMCMWLYSTNFKHYLMFSDNFGEFRDTYEKIAEYNTVLLFENTQYDNSNATGFHILKAYINAKLRWDTHADYDRLIGDWFDGYFKSASKTMKTLYDSIRVYVADVHGPLHLSGDVYYALEDKNLWSYSALKGWEKLINQAYADAASLKGTEYYDIVCDRITTESIFIRYALIQLYPGSYNQSDLLAMKREFKTDAMRLNFTRVREGLNISSLFNSWGV